MGHYLNVGNEGFRRALRSKIYVDKTMMIEYINSIIGTDDGFLCVSRPRRFGKSMAANMLAAYYDRSCDSFEMFKELKIAKSAGFETHLNQHNVIFLNIQQILSQAKTPENVPNFIQETLLSELREAYPNLISEDIIYLPVALEILFKEDTCANKGFVFIIDEWDCIFREAKEDTKAQKKYLDFLKDLFKDRIYVAVAYMTGILPIKKYGTHSALNIFHEYTMTDSGIFAEYVGFTEKEVKALCEQYAMDFKSVQQWYDGYRFADDLHIYNPKSVVDTMKNQKLKSYWVSTETYEALQIYINLDKDGLKEAIASMISGNDFKIDTRTFQNDMTSFKSKDDVLTLLIHLGYIAFDECSQSVYIPNEEVRREFLQTIKNGGRPELMKMLKISDEILSATLNMEADTVAS